MKNLFFNTLALVAVITFSLFTSCKFKCVRGSGHQTSETRKITEFTKIDVSGGFKINLKQDSSLSLTLTADDNLLKHIKTDVDGNTLRISTKNNMCATGQMVVNIGVRNLEAIKASGAVEILSNGKLIVKDLNLELSGVSKVAMDLNAANVHTEGSGATELLLKGQASSHDIELSGTGKVNALDFIVGNYNIKTSGATNCQINVLHSLNVHTSGASEISYRGNPTNISNEKSGASSINKIN